MSSAYNRRFSIQMTQELATANAPQSAQNGTRVNDVVIKIATANGSGSQSANLILMRSMYKMGVPVSGKNMFPSNIQGLPTWFSIRASEKGYLAQAKHIDICVAMNPDSAHDDIAELEPGATLIIRKRLASYVTRDDLNVFVLPFTDLAAEACEDTRLRNKVINVVYVGAIAYLLGIDMDTVTDAVAAQFGKKQKAIDLNVGAVQAGFKWAEANMTNRPPYRIERRNLTDGKILLEGNEATALGLMFGGASVAAWYPITPSSSVCEHLTRFMKKYRHEEDGKSTYAIIQAEDELGAFAMVLGAGWAGARSFTATSGPGMSLMAEMAGLSYFAEIPAVITNVQRMGPSTGLPTRTCQGDIASAYYLSHGDCKHPLLIPGSMSECYEFAMKALDLAQRTQTLVFLMSDLDLGMNQWLTDPFDPPKEPLDFGKVLNAAQLDAAGEFARYKDVDGDGIPYRTLPGTNHPLAAYFTRGTGHTEKSGYSEKPDNWQANMDRLTRKFETIRREHLPTPIIGNEGTGDVAIIAYGSTDVAIDEARDMLRENHNTQSHYMRVRALPIHPDAVRFIEDHDAVYLVEQNRDAQMASIIRAEYPHLATKIHSILHYDGMPINADTIVNGVLTARSALGEIHA